MAVELTKYEEHLFAEARKGDYNPFTSHFFQLPFSGTWYTPEDKPKVYERLHEIWAAQGKPGEDFKVQIEGKVIVYKLSWGNYGVDPEILYPHGYVLIDWGQDMLHSGKMIGIVEGGTGAAKTSTVGVAMLMFGALFPGFDALNVAPSGRQSTDMLDEIVKWCTGTKFEKFVVLSRNKELFTYRPHPNLKIDCGLGTYSTFMCQTLGGDIGRVSGNSILGTGKDWVNMDEAALIWDIEETLARLVTRYRGTRRDGRPRYSRPAFSGITNPHDNAQWGQLKERAQDEAENPDGVYYFHRPDADDNIYITTQQKRLHTTVLTTAQQERWLRGDDTTYAAMGTIPMPIIEQCRDPSLDEAVESYRQSGGLVELSDTMGITRYQLPMDERSSYLVWGDPGTANPISLNINNVPTCGVWDVTEFPGKAARLICLHVLHGGGKYDPWLSMMRELMITYKATGVYDATGMGKAMGEWPDMQNLPLYPVTLTAGNKATARTFFLLFAGRGLLGWPYIKMLWYQAQIYRESGPGTHKLADDVLAGFFVSAFYLRAAFWAQLAELFRWDEEDLVQHPSLEIDMSTRRGRYARRKSRYTRTRNPTAIDAEIASTLD